MLLYACPHSQNNQRLLNAISELVKALPLRSCGFDTANSQECKHLDGDASNSNAKEISLLLQVSNSIRKAVLASDNAHKSFSFMQTVLLTTKEAGRSGPPCLFLHPSSYNASDPTASLLGAPSQSSIFRHTHHLLDLFLATLLHLLYLKSIARHPFLTKMLINTMIALCTRIPGFRARLSRRDPSLLELVSARLKKTETEDELVTWLRLLNVLAVVGSDEHSEMHEVKTHQIVEFVPWLVQQM